MRLTHIMYKSNVNCSVLKGYLNFLIKHDLVEEKNVKKEKVIYAITQKGVTALKYFRELKQALPLIEETENHAPILF